MIFLKRMAMLPVSIIFAVAAVLGLVLLAVAASVMWVSTGLHILAAAIPAAADVPLRWCFDLVPDNDDPVGAFRKALRSVFYTHESPRAKSPWD